VSALAAEEQGRPRPSLVDNTEQALRNWLAHGGHRPGDRLPPELELASMLGVSRGTLRTALERLEESGEITRRQGSGTYVGDVAVAPTAFREGLEVLVSYSALARRRGVELAVRDVAIERRRVGGDVAEAFGVDPETAAVTISRVMLADRLAVALMRDTVHPAVELPPEKRLRRALDGGDMVLDILLDQGVPVAYARTRVVPRMLSGRDRVGAMLGVKGVTAVLELEETMYVSSGEAVQHSRDIFAPGGIDLQVRRNLETGAPLPVLGQRR
jgi:GntR family transcriptional regulator